MMQDENIQVSKDCSSSATNQRIQTIINNTKIVADVFEDTCSGILTFVPNGLDRIYNEILKKIPLIGMLFDLSSVEIVLKLLLGITIGQGIAKDIAKYFFRPFGMLLGILIGSLSITRIYSFKPYTGAIGEILYELSGQTIFGAIVSVLSVLFGFYYLPGLALESFTLEIFFISLAVGSVVGLVAKVMLLLAIELVKQAQSATIKRNASAAKKLANKLKEVARQKAKSRVHREAQDLIQQMHGHQSHEGLDDFFKTQSESVMNQINKKINRHLDYLTDRACCGDLQAFKKLQSLVPRKHVNKFGGKSPLDEMVQRIFNPSTLFNLKDAIDNSYDSWRYQNVSELT